MALEMKSTCERCQAPLEPGGEAYICSHECSFCARCCGEMKSICPNCGGELRPRPRRGPAASGHQLAQLNVARMVAPLDSPRLAGFVDNLERINNLAKASAGFVWQPQETDEAPTGLAPFGDDMLANLSVWEDLDSLHHFVYGIAHAKIMRRREEWFEAGDQAYIVLWWVPRGERPTLDEARARLEMLRRDGPGPDAFTFKHPFPAPGAVSEAEEP